MQFLTGNNWQFSFFKTGKVLLLLVLLMGLAPSSFRYVTTIKTDYRDFTSDHLNNAYIVKGTNTLIKYDKNGKRKAEFSNNKYGKLEYVDASNPLRLLLFFPDFSTVISLDNNLSQIGKYDLRKMGIDRISAIALANDNNVWVYDHMNYRLKKVSKNLSLKAESDPFTILFKENVVPTYMLERNNMVYLNDPQHGIYVFDNYASYHKRIPVTGIENFQILNNKLVYCQKGSMFKYDLQTFETDTIQIPGIDSVRDARLERNRLFLRRKNGLALYALGD